jgi:hypothetical protein
MAIYHLALQVIRRSEGRSAVAAAAYRTGQLLYDLRDGTRHDYTNKAVAEAFTLVPEGADWALDRERLWNAVEVAERRRKSTLAREWEVALPAELSDAARSELVRQFAQDLVDRYRVAADVGVHAPDSKGDSRKLACACPNHHPSGDCGRNGQENQGARRHRHRPEGGRSGPRALGGAGKRSVASGDR